MKGRREDLALKLELLRLRGQLQRTEAVAALNEVRVRSRRARDALSTLVGIGRVLSGARAPAFDTGSLALVATAIRDRPWLIPLAGLALKLARRRPAFLLAAAAAALAARWLLRHRESPAPSSAADAAVPPAATRADARP